MRPDELKLGAPLEIYINRDGYNYRVISKIEDATPDRIGVTLIASRTRVFQFLDTDVIDLVYRQDDKMWKWKNVKGFVIELEGSKLHAFAIEKEGEPFNRRNAFRLSFNEKIIIHHRVRDAIRLKRMRDMGALRSQMVLNYDKTLDAVKEDCYRWMDCDSFMRDISEYGAGFYCDDELEKGDEISFEFDSEFGMISCEGIIVRVKEDVKGYFDNYYGCRFTDTSKNLVKYLYETQRKRIKKNGRV